jgi:hypothetical protein
MVELHTVHQIDTKKYTHYEHWPMYGASGGANSECVYLMIPEKPKHVADN